MKGTLWQAKHSACSNAKVWSALMEGTDAMLKAANVEMVGWDKAGSGMVTAFVKGDVAAVKAAVDAGAEAAGRVGTVIAVHVIARPHDDLGGMMPKKKAAAPRRHAVEEVNSLSCIDLQKRTDTDCNDNDQCQGAINGRQQRRIRHRPGHDRNQGLGRPGRSDRRDVQGRQRRDRQDDPDRRRVRDDDRPRRRRQREGRGRRRRRSGRPRRRAGRVARDRPAAPGFARRVTARVAADRRCSGSNQKRSGTVVRTSILESAPHCRPLDTDPCSSSSPTSASPASSSSSSTWSKNGEEIARGGYERIGQAGSPYANARRRDRRDPEGAARSKPDAIGFKAVHGGPISGAVRVTDEVHRDDGAICRCRPGAQPAVHRGDEGVPREAARACRRWRRSRRRFIRRSRCRGRSTRSRTSGPKSSASADTAFTAHRIATSRRASRNWSARKAQADHLVATSAGQLEHLRDREWQVGGEQLGHDAADRVAAEQSRRRFRYVRPAAAD